HLALGDGALARRSQEHRGNAIENADRDVLVDRLLVKQHRATAFRHVGNAGPARACGAAKADPSAIHCNLAPIGLQLAEQNTREIELAAAHEAVDAEHFARARLERDIAQAASERKMIDPEGSWLLAARRQIDIVRIAVLELAAAPADHRVDESGLVCR